MSDCACRPVVYVLTHASCVCVLTMSSAGIPLPLSGMVVCSRYLAFPSVQSAVHSEDILTRLQAKEVSVDSLVAVLLVCTTCTPLGSTPLADNHARLLDNR